MTAFFLFVLFQIPQPDSMRAFQPVETVLVEASRLRAFSSDRNWVWRINMDSVRGVIGGQQPASVLFMLPGLYVADRENLSSGERIFVRGAGWRSNFGVRGVHIRYNGFPLTMPDGQTITSLIDGDLVQDIAFSPVSTGLFWGAGSSGLLELNDVPGRFSDSPNHRISLQAGSFGTAKTVFSLQIPGKDRFLHAGFSATKTNGFRENSNSEIIRYSVSESRIRKGRTLDWVLLGEYAPQQQNPGALNRAEWERDAKAANPLFERAKAGKATAQTLAGIKTARENESAGLWFLVRNLDNPLPFARISLNRQAAGGWLNYRLKTEGLETVFGVDLAGQWDDRQEFAVVDAVPTDSLLTDQREVYVSSGVYVRSEFSRGNWRFSPGLRFSPVFGKLDGAGNDRNMQEFPLLAQAQLAYSKDSWSVFAGYFSSFETATLNEWSAPETAENAASLQPEKGRTLEAGTTWQVKKAQLRLAVFDMRVTGRISSFESALTPGLILYRNEGETVHRGVEGSFSLQAGSHFTIAQTASVGSFSFKNGALDGKKLPAVPSWMTGTEVTGRVGAWAFRQTIQAVSARYLNNVNSEKTNGFILISSSISREIRLRNGIRFSPFFTVNNLLNENASASVSVNAANGRYFEPSAPRNFRIGISTVW